MSKQRKIYIHILIVFILLLTSACSFQSAHTGKTPPPESRGQITDKDQNIETTSPENKNKQDAEVKKYETNDYLEAPQNAGAVKKDPSEPIYKTTAHVNFREGPSTNDKVMTSIPAGEIIRVISESKYWLEAEYNGRTGYVSALYVAKEKGGKPLPSESNDNIESTIHVNGRLPILMYHAIDEYTGSGFKELYVTPENFRQQMAYLKSAGFTPITFEDLDRLEDFEKPIMITFDDGYKNNMNAYEILKELNSPAFRAKATIFMIGKKIDTASGLSSEELKEISDSGIISVQSHTETHPNLTTAYDFLKEFGNVNTKIKYITGKDVIALSYPAGEYDARVIEEAKEYYRYAVTTKSGLADLDSPYELNRIRINYSTTLEAFIQMVNQ